MNKPIAALTTLLLLVSSVTTWGQEKADERAKKLVPTIPVEEKPAGESKVAKLPGLSPLSKSFGLWVDMEK